MTMHNARKLLPRALALGLSSCFLVACAGSKPRPPELVRIENELARLKSDPVVAPNAQEELSRAQYAVSQLQENGRRMKDEVFDNNIYIADRLVQIAEAEGLNRGAKQRIDALTGERERLVADARAMETQRARTAADQARMDAEAARALADAERREAAMAREDANSARAELNSMRSMLSDLQAKQTDRGLVVTLGDVLFETDRAELKSGAQRNLDKLANALREHEKTTVAIEGHTDSTGASSYNDSLSQRRAQSVENYLTGHGIDRSRLTARGLGEGYPVANNDTAAGRQQNRRVEIIIQNEGA